MTIWSFMLMIGVYVGGVWLSVRFLPTILMPVVFWGLIFGIAWFFF